MLRLLAPGLVCCLLAGCASRLEEGAPAEPLRTEVAVAERVEDRVALPATIERDATGVLIASARAAAADVAYLELGDAVRIYLDGSEPRSASGRVVRLDSKLDPAAHTLLVEAEITDAASALQPGQPARLEISRRVLEDALLVPVRALEEHGSGFALFIVEQGVVRLRPVETGAVVGRRILITDGLRAGDRVVVGGHAVEGQALR